MDTYLELAMNWFDAYEAEDSTIMQEYYMQYVWRYLLCAAMLGEI